MHYESDIEALAATIGESALYDSPWVDPRKAAPAATPNPQKRAPKRGGGRHTRGTPKIRRAIENPGGNCAPEMTTSKIIFSTPEDPSNV